MVVQLVQLRGLDRLIGEHLEHEHAPAQGSSGHRILHFAGGQMRRARKTPASVGVTRNTRRGVCWPRWSSWPSAAPFEDVANNWAVLYLDQGTQAPIHIASLGVTVVLACQFIGRLLGDPMTDRWGREPVARSGGLLIAVGFLLAMAAPGYALAFVGFGLAGLGCATLVPVAFAAAGRIPRLPHGTGIAILGWLMRIGFLATSPAIGAFSDATDLRLALTIPLTAGLTAALIAHTTIRNRNQRRAQDRVQVKA